jgi:hypothetical protein
MNIHYVLELGKWLKLCFLTIQLEGVTSTSGITVDLLDTDPTSKRSSRETQ